MIAVAPGAWWRALGSLTRSRSAAEGVAWALYDFANTIYSFAVVSFAMGLWTTRHLGEADGTRWFTIAASASVLLNALVSPVLGAASDRAGRRKPFLAAFTALCVVATAVIGLVDVRVGLLSFALANFAYQGALIYYDALLPEVARPSSRGRLSGVGVASGYVGTLFIGVLLLAGISTDAEGRATPGTFILAAVLFAAFASPLFIRVRERARAGRFDLGQALASWSQLAGTVREARRHPGLLRFITARFFYTDPINTAIVVMAPFAVHAIGFSEGQALQVLLLLTVVAVAASFGWGTLADRWGPRRTLMAVLGTWVVGLVVIALLLAPIPFLIAGALLGAGLGGVGVTDRLLLLRLAPADQVGAMLGLYGLVGKLSAVVGPLVYGTVVDTLLPALGRQAYQWAIASLLGLMLIGVVIVRRVPEGHPLADPAAGSDADRRDAAARGDGVPLEPTLAPPAGGRR